MIRARYKRTGAPPGRLLVFALAAFVSMTTAAPVTAEKLRIVTEEFPPFDYTAANGEVAGLATEVVREVLAELDTDVRIEVLPWARALRLARTEPGTMLYSVVRTAEREDDFHWVGVVCEVKSYLFRLKERTDIRADTLDDLKGYTIGVVRDWAGQKYLERKGFTNIQPVVESDRNIAKLLSGRVDLIEDYEANLIHRMNALGIDTARVAKVYFNADISGPLYAAFNKETSDALVQRFRDAFDAVHRDGRYEVIQGGWRLVP